ncbi:MAG: SDR family oxidoreductase [Acidimicrobiia bacterium]|nr:SDR family oxidoreductase [Acidimicrobiia bacterium]
MKLDGRVVVVMGAGQTPGGTIGNGRASALTYAGEGARVLCADRDLASAAATAEMIREAGGHAEPARADVTDEDQIRAALHHAHAAWGRIDVLHNNVGISLTGGDAEVTEIEVDAFDRIVAVNLRSMVLACKHVLPIMREQRQGAIVNISSMAAISSYPYVAYKATKSAVIALTEQLAYQNARYGIRANVILPGLMNTPMAVEARAHRLAGDGAGDGELEAARARVVAERDAQVPLGGRMGTAWDVARAALFLASDDAAFITGVTLPVDGGASVRRG